MSGSAKASFGYRLGRFGYRSRRLPVLRPLPPPASSTAAPAEPVRAAA